MMMSMKESHWLEKNWTCSDFVRYSCLSMLLQRLLVSAVATVHTSVVFVVFCFRWRTIWTVSAVSFVSRRAQRHVGNTIQRGHLVPNSLSLPFDSRSRSGPIVKGWRMNCKIFNLIFLKWYSVHICNQWCSCCVTRIRPKNRPKLPRTHLQPLAKSHQEQGDICLFMNHGRSKDHVNVWIILFLLQWGR